jgi:hypothetical protein
MLFYLSWKFSSQKLFAINLPVLVDIIVCKNQGFVVFQVQSYFPSFPFYSIAIFVDVIIFGDVVSRRAFRSEVMDAWIRDYGFRIKD